MPRKGWKTFAIREQLYRTLQTQFEKRKSDLATKYGVSTFAGYMTRVLMEASEENEVLLRYGPFMQDVDVSGDEIAIRDNIQHRIAEVVFRKDSLFCLLDERSDCLHVGYAYSIPKVNKILVDKGVKLPKIRK
jgi:hypothetical protein